MAHSPLKPTNVASILHYLLIASASLRKYLAHNQDVLQWSSINICLHIFAVSMEYFLMHLSTLITPPPSSSSTEIVNDLALQHNISSPPLSFFPPRASPSHVYTVSFPTGQTRICCPVPNCVAQPVNRDRLRDHFCRRHPFDTIHITEESTTTQCRCCGKFVPHLSTISLRYEIMQTTYSSSSQVYSIIASSNRQINIISHWSQCY